MVGGGGGGDGGGAFVQQSKQEVTKGVSLIQNRGKPAKIVVFP